MLGPFVFCAGVGWVLGNRAECRCGYPPFVSAGNTQCECSDFRLILRVIGTEWESKERGRSKVLGPNRQRTVRLFISAQAELNYESTFCIQAIIKSILLTREYGKHRKSPTLLHAIHSMGFTTRISRCFSSRNLRRRKDMMTKEIIKVKRE